MHCGLHNPPTSTKKCKGCAHCFFLDALAILIAVTTAIKRRRRELVYSCGEIELLPPCTEAPPPWRGNPPFAGGGCARRREAPTPRKRRNFPLLAGGELLQPAFEDFWRLDLCCHQETREDSSFIVSSDHSSSLSSSGRLHPPQKEDYSSFCGGPPCMGGGVQFP